MYAGIDLGGTNIAAGLAKADGAIIKKISVPLGNAKNDPDEAAEKMAEVFLKPTENGERPKALGVGSPGYIDSENGVICFPLILKSF